MASHGGHVLRADAVFDLGLGVVLLLTPWQALYDAFDLPRPTPEVFTQIAGGLLIGFAYLLWVAPAHAVLQLHVTRAAALANALAVLILVIWLQVGDLGIGAFGQALLARLTLALAGFAVLEGRSLHHRGTAIVADT